VISKHRFAEIAAMFADPSRAAMLDALLGGRALPAGELARVADVSAATASTHLRRLRELGLVREQASGRHRYFRLAGPDVAGVFEALGRLAPVRPVRAHDGGRRAPLASARLCYDHLAGALGMAVTDALVRAGALTRSADQSSLALGRRARVVFARFDIDIDALSGGARPLVRHCTDWTERREHLAGALGAAFATMCLDDGWMRRVPGTRALTVSPRGRTALERTLKLRWTP
jgi:DNA-binding transcriptional ArsR family regulator